LADLSSNIFYSTTTTIEFLLVIFKHISFYQRTSKQKTFKRKYITHYFYQTPVYNIFYPNLCYTL